MLSNDEEFDEAGRDDDVEVASDGEFPGVGFRDGSGNDDGRASEEDDETTGVSGCDDGSCSGVEEPRENLFSKTLSLSKLTTTKSLNHTLRMSFHLLLFFFSLSMYFLHYF